MYMWMDMKRQRFLGMERGIPKGRGNPSFKTLFLS